METSSLLGTGFSSRDVVFASAIEVSDGDSALELDWRALTAAGLPMISDIPAKFKVYIGQETVIQVTVKE